MLAVLLALAIIGMLLVVIIAGQPDEFTVLRSTTIAASTDAIFPLVNELKKWDAWSPWAKIDPSARYDFAGPLAGTDSSMSWDGNRKVGAGRMTIIESTPMSLIRLRLEFRRPFKATNTAEFKFAPEGAHTRVTWIMSGTNNFMSKAFSLFVNMDKMIGGDFEKGLAQMKSVTEGTTQ